jgi:pyruvate dehydrogenase E2 component (dihydrolipoamide acetyltransferase)
MAKQVILPALGMAQETGKILEWLKAEGDAVAEGEPLALIETDKATVDLEAPASGVLAGVSAAVGADIPVGQIIALILSPEEAAAHSTASQEPPPPVAVPGTSAALAPTTLPLAPQAALQAAPPGSPETHGETRGRPLASPKARRLAAEHGESLAAISGSGPGGAVLAADVLAASPPEAPIAGAAAPPFPVAQRRGEGLGERHGAAHQPEMSTTWRLMAERTTHSWTTVPHFFLGREVRAAQLIAWRERLLRESSDTITYTDLLVKIVAEALQRHPRLNARWENGAIVFNDEINVGLAVAVEDGLVVPVIHQADGLNLGALAKRRNDLVTRAQAGKLRLRDLQDGTFTISNLGMYGVDTFSGIINAPQASILAVGRIVERVVPMDGQSIVQPMMTLSLSCDHRVVDGARGAQFLATVADLIERPLEER